ncbi:hypothetical protein N7481_004201 [Penicillium waksmanii]|uniref:uncharacterized protein n=1 Tax=Penicillium waksmanii TaxID=69791 RepID=UPI0025469090|nr:uncharacterized protein N7481_004201 [Penicillium waksmanii]KAJ5988991.1 hypothetical protein N7481_004201 [Penicillium waksmanii]
MRTRSKPLSPSSYLSLDDNPITRRRRTTRSASAQPQEPQVSQPAEAAPAPKTSKARGRKKGSTKVAKGKKPGRPSTREAVEIEHQDSALTGESAVNGGPTGPCQDAEAEAVEPAVNSFEQPTSVLPSVETNDDDEIPDTAANRPEYSLQRVPRLRLVPGAPWFAGFAAGRDPAPGPFILPQETTHRASERGSSSDGSDIHPLELQHEPSGLEPRSDEHVAPFGSPHVSTHRVVPGRKGVRSCLSRALRKVACFFTPSRCPRSPVAEEEFEWRYSNLDQMLIKAPSRTGTKWGPIGPKRQFRKDKQPAYHIMSPSNSPSKHNRVEKAFKTTPIRRTRSSYAAISRRRRTEASGRIDRTLYRLPELLSQNETDGDVAMTANPTTPPDRTDAFTTENIPTAGAESLTENPPASPGIVRWAFNNISRRWTNIRDRYAGNQPTEAQSPGAQTANAMLSPSPSNLSAPPQTDLKPSNRHVLTPRPTRSYSLYSSGLDPELKARCYGRKDSKQDSKQDSKKDSDQSTSEKRKREVSPTDIPNPKGSSYGMDDDFFVFTEEEYAEEEKRQAEEQKRKAEEEEHVEAGAPSAKKIRVDQPKWPNRRSTHRSSTKVRAGASSPSQQPGFQPNRRHTYETTPLETIESSRLLEEAEAHAEAQTATDSNAVHLDPSSDTAVLHLHPPPPRIPEGITRGPGFVPNPHGTFEVPYSSSPPSSPTRISQEITRVPGFFPNPHGTFEVPYSSSDIEMMDVSDTDLPTQVSNSVSRDMTNWPTQAEPAEARDPGPSIVNGMSNAYIFAMWNRRRRREREEREHPPMRRAPGTINNQSEDPTNSTLLGSSQISGEDDLLPLYYTGEGIRNATGNNETSIPLTSDPLDESPDVVVNFNPDGTLADDQVAATVSDSDDESPLTRARTKAEQFKPKTPSRLREAHRFSSSMTRTSPFSQADIAPPVFDRQEPVPQPASDNQPAPENEPAPESYPEPENPPTLF